MIGGNPRPTCTPSWAAGAAAGWATSSPRAGRVRTLLLPPEAIHTACEDYRASAGIDLDHDRESRARGDKIACDTLVLWGEHGVVQRLFEPLALWQAQCAGQVTGWAMPPGISSPSSCPRRPPRRLE
jgi:haloacetate dehalogenase